MPELLLGVLIGYVAVGLSTLAAVLVLRRRPDVARDSPLLDQVIDLALLHGWRVHHGRPGRTADGSWRTAVKGHAGFPDLVMVNKRRDLLVMVEIKPDGGYPSAAQREWLGDLAAVEAAAAPFLVTGVWRPRDWAEIVELVTGRAPNAL